MQYEDRYGKYWYLNGELHREDGPALEYYNGTKHWYINGKRHREDGPAIKRYNGGKYWYLNGIRYSEAQYWKNARCEYCGGKQKSIKTIDDVIYYCPKCQR